MSFTVIDLGSTNGTFVNDKRVLAVREEPLAAGDVLKVGETEIDFVIESSRCIAASSPTRPRGAKPAPSRLTRSAWNTCARAP